MSRVLRDFNEFWREISRKKGIGGIEFAFVASILLLRVVSLSYWFRSWLPSARGDRRQGRDKSIDIYCVVQAAFLLGLLFMSERCLLPVWLGGYILFELFLVLANTVFVGKFRSLQAKPASIERSLLLLLLNVLDVVLIFAIFYRHALHIGIADAVVQSSLVLGTVGYPEGLTGPARLLVPIQIFLGLVLNLLLLSSFVGQLGLFRSREEDSASRNADSG